MTLKQIYIARHGYRANWLPPPHPPNPTGIDSDPPLAGHGVDQAKQLAAYITSLPAHERPQFILTSPFYRCVETAQPIAEMLDLSIVIERGVGEWYKKNRGVIPAPADYEQLQQFFPKLATKDVWHRDETVGVVPDLSGETEEDIFARASLFWSKFIPVFEEKFPEYENILIVSHAATKIALGMSLMGFNNVFDPIDNEGNFLRAGACSIDKYELNPASGKSWDIVMNGNCEFLTDGEEMNWTFHSAFEAGSDEDIKARKEEARRKEEAKSSRETTPVTELAEGTDSATNANIEYEDIFVTVDIPWTGDSRFDIDTNEEDPSKKDRLSTRHMINPTSHFQITNIDDAHPLVKLSNNTTNKPSADGAAAKPTSTYDSLMDNLSLVDNRIYQTDWAKLVGTDLIFDDYGELIGKVNEHLICDPSIKFIPKEKDDQQEDEEKPETSDESGPMTPFMRKAMKTLAAKKQNQ